MQTPRPARSSFLLRVSAVATLVTIAIALIYAAQEPSPGPMPGGRGPGGLSGFAIITALDTDGLPGLSGAEIDAAPAVLGKLDRNGDGRLTADELPAVGRGGRGGRGGPGGPEGRGGFEGRGRGEGGPEGPAANPADELVETLMAFDGNKDGKLTRAEVPERMQGIFDRADTNKDGELTADEIRKSAATQPAPQGAGPGGGREGREGREGEEGRGRGGRGGFGGGPDALVTALDANRDGALSTDEIRNAPTVLRTLDRNGDGALAFDEVFGGGPGRGRG